MGIDDLHGWCSEFGFILLSASASATVAGGNIELLAGHGFPQDYRVTYVSDLVYEKP